MGAKTENHWITKVKKVVVVPIGRFGTVTRIGDWFEKLDISAKIEHLRKTAVSGSFQILRKYLNTTRILLYRR